MPKHLEPLRKAAIGWMTTNFPYTSSKWEHEVTYVTPAPEINQNAQTPGNAVANDESVK